MNLELYTAKLRQTFERIPFMLYFLGIAVYFYINGPAHFENWSSTYGQTLLAYIIMLVVFLMFTLKRTEKTIEEPMSSSVKKYVLSFSAMVLVMLILGTTPLFSFGKISPNVFWQVFILQLCVVSVSEEVIFRGVILDFFKKLPWTGIVISSFLFMVFHSAAYGVQYFNLSSGIPYGSLLFAFMFGVILSFLVVFKPKIVGIPGAIAIHFVYNAFVLGIFSGVIA